MRIVIVGDGKIGSALAEQLSREGHEITIVDRSGAPLQLKARDTEAHVGRVAERRQHECCDADDNTGQNDEQVFFFHVLFPPI